MYTYIYIYKNKLLKQLTITINAFILPILFTILIYYFLFYFRELSEKQNLTLLIQLTQNITDRKSTLFVVWLDPCIQTFFIFIIFLLRRCQICILDLGRYPTYIVVSCTDAYIKYKL